MRQQPDGTLALLVAALRDGATHIEALLTLARTEVDGNIRAIVSLIAIVGTIPVLLIVTFFLGLDATVKLLAVPFGSEAPAALIVVGALPGRGGLARLARRPADGALEPGAVADLAADEAGCAGHRRACGRACGRGPAAGPGADGGLTPARSRPASASPVATTVPASLRGTGRAGPPAQSSPAMIARMRPASASMAKGLVIIRMPGSRWPLPKVAFSA